jgi:periplasmic copper chaperone A
METKLKLGTYLFVSMLFVSAFDSRPAQSQEVKLGDLVISQPWSRAAPRGAELASSYLTIENKGATADRLVGGSAEVAEKLEIQQISMVGGAASQATLDKGLAIAPGDKVVMAPGGYKLALLKLKSALKKGTKVAITLEFEKAGKTTVSFDVLGPAAKGPAAPKADDKMKK